MSIYEKMQQIENQAYIKTMFRATDFELLGHVSEGIMYRKHSSFSIITENTLRDAIKEKMSNELENSISGR